MSANTGVVVDTSCSAPPRVHEELAHVSESGVREGGGEHELDVVEARARGGRRASRWRRA